MANQPRSEETRQRILRAAEESFARRGYDATSVAEICARAEVSKGAFYHHFASKQSLFLDLMESWLAELTETLSQTRSHAESVPEALRAMAPRIREVFRRGGRQLPIFLEFLNKASRDPAVWQATIAPYRRYHEYFAALIEEGVKEGSLRVENPKHLAQILVSLAVGVVLQAVLDPYGADWEKLVQEGMDLLLDDRRSKTR